MRGIISSFLRVLRISAAALVLVLCAGPGCRHAEAPLPAPPIFSITDKFFDVKAVGPSTFLALAYGSKVFRSEDGGSRWQGLAPIAPRSLTRLSVGPGDRVWAVGHEGKVFHSQDGGKTWAEQASGTKLSLFDVDFVNAERGFAVGDLSGVIATLDGGRTWHVGKIEMSMIGVREDMSLAISDPIYYGVDFVDENTGWVVGEFGQIRFTDDGGATWGAQHGGLLGTKYRDIMSLPSLLCVRFRDRQRGIAVGTYGTILSTDDGGTTWRFNESPVAIPLYDIRMLPDGEALIVGSSGVVLRGTPESGWRPATLPEGIFTWISAVDFDSAGRGLAVGGHGLVLSTRDFGKTWEWRTNG